MYNRLTKNMRVTHNDSHTYNGNIRLWNNTSTNNIIRFVLGLGCGFSMGHNSAQKAGADGSYAITNVKFDGDTGIGNHDDQIQTYNVQWIQVGTTNAIHLSAGYHYVSAYEWSNHNSSTFYASTLSSSSNMF